MLTLKTQGDKVLFVVNRKIRGYVQPTKMNGKEWGYSYNIGKPSDTCVSSFSGNKEPLTFEQAKERLTNAIIR